MSIQLFNSAIPSAISLVEESLASGQIADGPNISALEKAMENLFPAHHGVTFANMTLAIETALVLSGVGPGDEVLTVAFNCLSSNAAIHNSGALPIWIDINADTGTLDIDDAIAQITPKTKAIIVYHIAGYPADTATIRKLCDEFGLILIEDANASYGGRHPNGSPIGSYGDFSIFSFYANRQVNGAEGAILMCKNSRYAELARCHRRFGIDLTKFRDSRGQIDPACDVERIGVAGNMNNLNAAIALSSLSSVNDRMAKVSRNAIALENGMFSMPRVRAVMPLTGSVPAYWVFMILTDYQDRVLDRLFAEGIQSTKLHHPNNIYSGFKSVSRTLPSTEKFRERMVGLPVGWWLEPCDIDRIVSVVNSI